MSPPLVVEDLNVVEQRHLGVAATVEVFPELVLDRGEPTLHHGVVVAIPATAHAAGHPMRRDDPLVILARIRTPLVGVMQETRGRLTAFQGHPQCLDDEMAIVDGTDGPADEEPRVEVEDRRQVERTTAANDELGSCRQPQRWFGASATKSWPSTFAATG